MNAFKDKESKFGAIKESARVRNGEERQKVCEAELELDGVNHKRGPIIKYGARATTNSSVKYRLKGGCQGAGAFWLSGVSLRGLNQNPREQSVADLENV